MPPGCRHDDMDVLCAGVRRMQVPTAHPTVLGNGILHETALLRIQGERRFSHASLSDLFACRVRGLELAWFRHPAAFVTRQPCTVGRPCQQVCQRIPHGKLARIVRHGNPLKDASRASVVATFAGLYGHEGRTKAHHTSLRRQRRGLRVLRWRFKLVCVSSWLHVSSAPSTPPTPA